MKCICLILLVLYLLLPMACFAHPCASCLGLPDSADTSETGHQSQSHQADSCDTSVCCGACLINSFAKVTFNAPLVVMTVTPEQYKMLPEIVMPIIVPPQNIV
jgi:hypothetical protein